jgi:hypothetical protein
MANKNIQSVNLLPEFLRTDKNSKFLSSTLDQLIQSPQLERIDGYVGSKLTPNYISTSDVYISDTSPLRSDYQLDPALIIQDGSGTISDSIALDDLINEISIKGGIVDNLDRLIRTEFYSYNPHIDWDKLINFQQYYWLPTGPDPILITGKPKNTTSKFTVTDNELGSAYIFTPDGLSQDPLITLYRGNVYMFDINSKHKFYIKTTPTSGNADLYNINVINNGITTGTIRIIVDHTTPSTLFYVSGDEQYMHGQISIESVVQDSGINVEYEIIGKSQYISGTGVVLSNGMKISFGGDVSPANYQNKEFFVEGVGKAIALIDVNLLDTSGIIASVYDENFDSDPFDEFPFDNFKSLPINPEYITINRASKDLNPWSRYNRWVHGDVIAATAIAAGKSPVFPIDQRARRPIIEFSANLRLYNFGARGIQNVDLIDTVTTNVFGIVQGSSGYYIDGILIQHGHRIIFNADADPLVHGKVYQANYYHLNGKLRLELLATPDHDPNNLSSVSVSLGSTYAGTTWWYNGTSWVFSQQHNKLNQPPLFDLFDDSGNSYGDKNYYLSDFSGNAIFSYGIGNGKVDPVLGFPLQYKNSLGVGSYVFNNNLTSDHISITTPQVPTITILSGQAYCQFTDDLNNLRYANAWTTTKSYQIPIIQFQSITTATNTVQITALTGPTYDAFNTEVYVNTIKLQTSEFSVEMVGSSYYVLFANQINSGDNVLLRIYTAQASTDKGYYESPIGLTNNPLNGSIPNFTLTELSDHLGTMTARDPNFTGVFPGNSNIRNLNNIESYGTRLVSNANPLVFANLFIGKKEHSLVDAIVKAGDQYNQFKVSLLSKISNIDQQLSPINALDSAMMIINANKNHSSPYYLSDMLAYGTNVSTRSWTVIDARSTIYPISSGLDITKLSIRSVLVYLNGKQLTINQDYVFDAVDSTLIIKTPLMTGDQLVVNDYPDTTGSFIPPTPTKLGLYPKYRPKIYLDNTYANGPVKVIQGHDGSITAAFNDYRDEILLEFELRVYNNLKTEYRADLFDINSINVGAFRTNQFNQSEINQILASDFMKWAGSYGVDYTTNDVFDAINSYTWNYNGGYCNQLQLSVSGYWRSIFKYFYDTDRPHTNPWEMLGFSEQPDWWTDTYGPAPYTSGNDILWQDIENGMIRGPIQTINSFYARDGLRLVLPVDDGGNLIDPSESLISNITAFNRRQSWVFGDQGPAETAWRRSSYWPFAVQRLMALTKPASYAALMYDPAHMTKNIAGQWSYGATNSFLSPKNLLIHGENSIAISGYGVYVSEIGMQRTSNYISQLRQHLTYLNFNLFYKVGGFVSQDKLQVTIDAYDPTSNGIGALLSKDDYKLRLNVSNPIKSIGISGVIVQKSNGAFVVKGYDNSSPYFNVLAPTRNSNTSALTVGGVSSPYVVWGSSATGGNTGLTAAQLTTAKSASVGKFYQQGQIVSYGGKFYRVTVSHQSENSFNSTYYQLISSLPTVGGVAVQTASGFSSDVTMVPYGTEFTDVQAVYDLIIGYGKWLVSQGFIFDEFNQDFGLLIDWDFTAKEFLYWSTQNWANNSVITLSPFADGLKYQFANSVVDNIFDRFYEYSVQKADGTSFPQNNLTISRQNGIFSASPINTNDGIYFARLNSVQKEHAMIFNNNTMFSDTIYDIETGYRQARVRLTGFRTTGWAGDYFSPGFVYDTAQITYWSPYQSYQVGSVVEFNGNYYAANSNNYGSATFNFSTWDILDKKPVAGLIPNFDYKINQFEDFYSLDIDNFDVGQEIMAQHLTGYTPRVYLNNIFTNPISQYKFYQGFIREKGTKKSVTKLARASIQNMQGQLTYNEEWAFRVGQYGSYSTYQELEFPLVEGTFIENPQIITFSDSSSTSSNAVTYFVTATDITISPSGYTANSTFAVNSGTYLDNNFVLSTAGYARLDDVTATAYNENSLLDIANSRSINNGDVIWVGFKQNGDWDVLRYEIQKSSIVGVFVSAPGSSITFTTDLFHGLVVGDYISVIQFNAQVDGIYVIVSIPHPNQFTVASTLLSITNDQLASPGKLFKFASARYDTFDDFPNDKTLCTLPYDTLMWVDNSGTERWAVYQKINNYNYGRTASQNENQAQQLGWSIGKSKNSDFFVVSAPNAYSNNRSGLVYAYQQASTSSLALFNYTFNSPLHSYMQNVSGDTGLGYSLVYDDMEFNNSGHGLIFAGAPAASQLKTQTYYSNTFNGNTDYLTVSSTSALQISNHDFTIEAWVNLSFSTTSASRYNIVAKGGESDANFEYAFYLSGNTLALDLNTSASNPEVITYKSNATTFITNKWNHLAVTKSGSNTNFWFNGINIGNRTIKSSSGAVKWHTGSGNLGIGASSAGDAYFFPGSISSLRIINGYAQYTSAFTLKKEPLTAVSGTELLSCQSSSFLDDSVNNYTINVHGATKIGAFSAVSLTTETTISSFVGQGAVKVSSVNPTLLQENSELVILSPSPSNYQNFGSSLYVQKNTSTKLLIVGAAGTQTTGTGHVYSYTLNVENSTVSSVYDSELIPTGISLKVGAQWGYSVSGSDDAMLIAVGAPGYSNNSGIVQLFSGISKQFIQNILPPANISVFQIRFGNTVLVSPSGNYLFVSAPDARDIDESYGMVFVYVRNSQGTFDYEHTLANPIPGVGMLFGISMDINSASDQLIVSALGKNRPFDITFDSSNLNTSVPTTFDEKSTRFYDVYNFEGTVYSYSRKSSRFVFVQELHPKVYIEGSNYGNSVSIGDDGVAIIGSPAYSNKTISSSFYQFYPIDPTISGYNIIRSQDDTVDISVFERIVLIDTFNEETLDYLEIIDPVKGKISGLADQELKYKSAFDPAVYSMGTSGTINNTNSNWLDDHVGELWWDLSTVKYMWYEQGDTSYRKNYWGNLFPGSTVDVYEWVGSTYLPTEWSSLADTPAGLVNGISGQPKFADNSVISVKQVYDTATKSFYNYYYYWVKNKVTVPTTKNRRLGAYQVASIIADPTAYGLEYISVISNNSMIVSNLGTKLVSDRISLNISFDNINNPIPKHTQWLILSEGDENSRPSVLLEKKLIDSLLGHDSLGNLVPSPALSSRTRYGLGIRPQQTLFKNRFQAIRNIIEFSNNVLISQQITGNYEFANLNAQEQIPSQYSNEYDAIVEDLDSLSNIDVTLLSVPELTCTVKNGKVASVSIVKSGYGYKVAPTVNTSGNAVISLEIDSSGKVVSANIDAAGSGYSDDNPPVLGVRSFNVIVLTDSEINNKWGMYSYDTYIKKWVRSHTQKFNTTLYWNYVDWKSADFDQYMDYVSTISNVYELDTVNPLPGQYVKVNNGGDGRFIILKALPAGSIGTFSPQYDLVFKQQGTIQFSNNLWDYENSNYGFDKNNSYDQTLYNQTPDLELQYIISALRDDLFVNQLKVNWNLLFFTAVRYALTEQKLLDWAFKTSFISAINLAGPLDQRPVFKLTSNAYYEKYLDEIKPYHTQVRNYTTNYTVLDPSNTFNTDFDLPAVYDRNQDMFSVLSGNDIRFGQYPWKSWNDNHSYQIGSISIGYPGSGYLTAPSVSIIAADGDTGAGATAEAYIRSGKIIDIVVTNSGKNYSKAPTVKLFGGGNTKLVPAVVYANLDYGLVRTNKISMKFDRISRKALAGYQNQTTDRFLCDGIKDKFVLNWLVCPNKSKINILLDGVLVFNSEYSIQYFTEMYQGYSKEYSQIVFLNAVPNSGQLLVVNYQKNINLLDANQRIMNFYTATSGMPGLDLGQLMYGMEYPKTEVLGLPLNYTTNWDITYAPFGTTAWADDVSYYNVFTTSDISNTGTNVLSLNTTSGIMVGQLVNIVSTTANKFSTNTDVTVTGVDSGRITISSTLRDAVYLGEQIEIWSYDSSATALDTVIDGGTWSQTTASQLVGALGINPADIIIDGEYFLTPNTSYAPEELVPGQVLESLGISVYTKNPQGAPIVISDSIDIFANTTVTQIMSIVPPNVDSIMVNFENRIFSYTTSTTFDNSSEFSINWETNQITIPPQKDSGKLGYTIISIGGGVPKLGAGVVDTASITVVGVQTAQVQSLASMKSINSAYVTVNGQSISNTQTVTDAWFSLNGVDLANQRAAVDVYNLSTGTNTITAWFFNSPYQYFNQTQSQTFGIGQTPQDTLILSHPPANIEPAVAQIIVEITDSAGRRRLRPPFVSYYQVADNVNQFAINNHEILPPNTFNLNNVRLYINGILVTTGLLYSVNSETSTVTINDSEIDTGDVIAIVSFAQDSWDYDVTGNTLKMARPISNATLKAITYSNQDGMLMRTERFIGNSFRRYVIIRPALNNNYVWVELNGIPLVDKVDYELLEDDVTVQISDKFVNSSTDTIVIISISSSKLATTILGYRIFDDLLGRTQFKRLSGKNTTYLTKPLKFTDTEIYVADATVLTPPLLSKKIPGIVLIAGERIEFFKVENNVLSSLRRSTLGTAPNFYSETNTTVIDQSPDQTIPYSEQILVQKHYTTSTTNTYVISTVTNVAIGDGIVLSTDPEIPAVDQVKIYYGGRLLNKSGRYYQDLTLAYDSPDIVGNIELIGSTDLLPSTNTIGKAFLVTSTNQVWVYKNSSELAARHGYVYHGLDYIPPEFTINPQTQQITLNIINGVTPKVKLIIVKRQFESSSVWNDKNCECTTKSLMDSTTIPAKFLQARPTNLPDWYYYGGDLTLEDQTGFGLTDSTGQPLQGY